MKGQWIGTYQGSVEGRIIVNIDEVEDHYKAVAYIKPNNKDIPASVAYLNTLDKSPEQQVVAYLNIVNPKTGFQCTWEEVKDLFPEGVTHSEKADVTLKLEDGILYINALSDIGVEFSSVLPKPSEDENSKILSEKMSWKEFKSLVSTLSNSNSLFRGQKKPWRLKTSFHRRGRYLISEFTAKDVKQLHKRLSAITSHYFDLSTPEQNGSFFNLIQHHGYPTPLLDWTYSPYVSAFFAFRDWPFGYSGEENSRIYIFDYDAWKINFAQIQNLDPLFPHFSVIDFIALDNPRLVPQQSVTTVTNMDDIEAYILQCEAKTENTYLRAIDIPANEREVAMKELRFMGITAGSMFPSIDGVCEELRERNFDK